jgi:probable F420-dependent oxidoreductase
MANRVSIGMGIMHFPFSSARSFWRWVDMCEEGGIDSLWQSDRLISEQPFLESISSIAAVAGRTRKLKFGMNVVCLAQRDPVLVAKQCATIDMLSEGRLLPAFGVGSERAPEWDAMGLGRDNLSARTDEALEIIHRLWTEDRVDFDGKYFQLSKATISPKPAQKEMPAWIGGPSKAAIRRTARFGTGWLAGAEAPSVAGPIVARVREAAKAAGRAIDEDHYGAGFPFRFGSIDDIPELPVWMADYWSYRGLDPMIYYAIGDAATIVERIAEYVRVGIYKFILRPLSRDDDDFLLQTRRLIEEVLPMVAARWPKSGNCN